LQVILRRFINLDYSVSIIITDEFKRIINVEVLAQSKCRLFLFLFDRTSAGPTHSPALCHCCFLRRVSWRFNPLALEM